MQSKSSLRYVANVTLGSTSFREKTGADCPDSFLHCEDGAEPGLTLRNTVVGLGCLRQWVRLNNRSHLSFCHEIKRFVQIFGAVLLTSNYSNAFRDEIHQRYRKWLRIS